MVRKSNVRIPKSLEILPFLFLLMALPAWAQDASATAPTYWAQTHPELIQRLKAARTTDWNSARDPSVSPVRQGTFLDQMNKADRAVKKLEHGFGVSQSELNDALWIPPKHISPQLRAQLIQELQSAKQQDDRNEQQMLIDSAWGHSPQIDTVTFDQHKQLVDSTIEDLEIGVPVHWSDIREALIVPPSPD